MTSHASQKTEEPHVLILGAYGLLGAGIATHLSATRMKVTGFGRDLWTARRVLPEVNWIIDDLRTYCKTEAWDGTLEGISVVVNCSGALQDGPNDELECIHHEMIAALATACSKRGIQLIQISAVGASANASTEFLSSKARGDDAIKEADGRYTIFRPGLILAPSAYGGTALLRMLAAIPIFHAVSFPKTRIQTIALSDICYAVELAIIGKLPDKFECDLVEEQTQNLSDLVIKLRSWLGFKAAKFKLTFPKTATHVISKCADVLSWMGWKTPLRSTSIKVLQDGIVGDPTPWNSLNLFEISPLSQTLSRMRATAEDRLSARMSVMLPFLVGALSLFWMLSGIIGLISIDEAAAILKQVGWQQQLAIFSVLFWAIVDIALGCAVLFKKFAKAACYGMVITSVIYLVASSIFTPQLWLDPLGPLVKILPAIILALVTSITLENR